MRSLKRLFAQKNPGDPPRVLWPPKNLLRLFPLLSLRERVFAIVGTALVVLGTLAVVTQIYLAKTRAVPSPGGTVIEGIVGRPLFPNPILTATQADRDLTLLTYAGLLRYDDQGHLVNDLARDMRIGENGRVFELTLKDGIHWPTGDPFEANDVLFTIQSIQNPTIRSPLYPQWLGVKVEAVDEHTVRFTLPAPFAAFPHNLTVGILPAKVWEGTEPGKFSLAEENLQPVGLGPFTAKRFERRRSGEILSYTLEPNEASPRKAILGKLFLKFFDTPEGAVAAFNTQEVDAVGGVDAKTLATSRTGSGVNLTFAKLPRLIALYMNQSVSHALADKSVRQALASATDKDTVIRETLGGPEHVIPLEGPLLHGVLGYTDSIARTSFDPSHSKELLDAAGWKDANGDGIREKEFGTGKDKKAENLNLVIVTAAGGELENAAHKIADHWNAVGTHTEVQALAPADLRAAIQNRTYTVLLVGVDLAPDPDIYSLFHSSQKQDPGRNFSLYDNKNLDKVLENLRAEQNPDNRAKLAQDAQHLIVDDVPTIFIGQRTYPYLTDNRIQGMNVSFLAASQWRFGEIEKWFVQTKRIPK